MDWMPIQGIPCPVIEKEQPPQIQDAQDENFATIYRLLLELEIHWPDIEAILAEVSPERPANPFPLELKACSIACVKELHGFPYSRQNNGRLCFLDWTG